MSEDQQMEITNLSSQVLTELTMKHNVVDLSQSPIRIDSSHSSAMQPTSSVDELTYQTISSAHQMS